MASAPVPMDTSQTVVRKRKADSTLVDVDTGRAIINSKRPTIQIDEDKKVKCLNTIVDGYVAIVKKVFVGHEKETFLNLSIGSQIANTIFTCHSILRMRTGSTVKGNAELKTEGKDFTYTSMDQKHTIKVSDALTIMTKAATDNGLIYKRYDEGDKENWYGTMGPYITFMTCFDLRVQELRLGHKRMPHKKVGDSRTEFPVSCFGLSGIHHVLLEGCSFPPEKRSSIAQSLGPMTALLTYMKSDNNYRNKWASAVKRSMAHLPFVDDLLEVLKGKSASESAPLITIVADILLIATSRQAHRMYFPINFYHFWKSTGKVDVLGLFPDLVGQTVGEDIFKGITVSGVGGYYAYYVASMQKWSFEGNFTESEAAQVVFHAIFGTYKEDLGILSKITNLKTWNTREEFGNKFSQMRTCGKLVQMEIPKFNMISKLSSANQSGLLATSYTQTTSIPVFSGKRKVTFNEEFFEQIARKAGAHFGGKTIAQLMLVAQGILTDLIKTVQGNGNMLEMGTTEWFKMEGTTIKDYGAPTTESPRATGKLFLGRRNPL